MPKRKSLLQYAFYIVAVILIMQSLLLSACSGVKCKTCNDEYRIPCSLCVSRRCTDCDGKGMRSCPACGGSGIVPCLFCNGEGKIFGCVKCNNTGNAKCPNCYESQTTFGKVLCHTCGGHGLFGSNCICYYGTIDCPDCSTN